MFLFLINSTEYLKRKVFPKVGGGRTHLFLIYSLFSRV